MNRSVSFDILNGGASKVETTRGGEMEDGGWISGRAGGQVFT